MDFDQRISKLLGTELPIIQAPMAGANGSAMAAAVSRAGGLGSLPCALLTPDQIREETAAIRDRTDRPFNVNFFCHWQPEIDDGQQAAWKHRLAPFYAELGIHPEATVPSQTRRPFDEETCQLLLDLRPKVASFHFGLPDRKLFEKVKGAGIVVISSATTVEEAMWLEQQGCDAVIAQGLEAGGHRGMFLTDDVATQVGLFALLPQIADAVRIPIIAAGGIMDGRGIAACLKLGASAVQLGTAYLFCPESTISSVHRTELDRARDDKTVVTNVYTGRPARGIVNRLIREVGPLSNLAPSFPHAAHAIAPLRRASENAGSPDFALMWSGQAARLGRTMPAANLTTMLVSELLAC